MAKKIKPQVGMVVKFKHDETPKTILRISDDLIQFRYNDSNAPSFVERCYFDTDNYEVIWQRQSRAARRGWAKAAQHLRDVAEQRQTAYVVPDNEIPEVEFVWCNPVLHDDIKLFLNRQTPESCMLAAAGVAESLALDGC